MECRVCAGYFSCDSLNLFSTTPRLVVYLRRQMFTDSKTQDHLPSVFQLIWPIEATSKETKRQRRSQGIYLHFHPYSVCSDSGSGRVLWLQLLSGTSRPLLKLQQQHPYLLLLHVMKLMFCFANFIIRSCRKERQSCSTPASIYIHFKAFHQSPFVYTFLWVSYSPLRSDLLVVLRVYTRPLGWLNEIPVIQRTAALTGAMAHLVWTHCLSKKNHWS